MNLSAYIRDIPDFPKQGIIFKDITPLLSNHDAFRYAIDELKKRFTGVKITKIVGAEARGFLVGAALSYSMGIGFVPIRKPNKLPYKTVSYSYQLEYGSDTLCIHEDALTSKDHVLVVDDLLATGGTAAATVELCRKLGAEIVGVGFLVELDFLNGREKLNDLRVESLIHF